MIVLTHLVASISSEAGTQERVKSFGSQVDACMNKGVIPHNL